MEVRPGNRKIVHHTVVYAIEPDAPAGTPETGVVLHEYAVGKYGDIFNDYTGRLLKAGTRIRFDMHYFAIGEELTDQTEMAFIFYPKGVTPKYEVRSITSGTSRTTSSRFRRTPWSATTATSGCTQNRADRRLPAAHAHARARHDARGDQSGQHRHGAQLGRSLRLQLARLVLYADDVAPLLPAGTVLHIIGTHDNTAPTAAIRIPTMWAGFGERSVDDMLQVWLNVVYLDDAEFKRLVDERKAKEATPLDRSTVRRRDE